MIHLDRDFDSEVLSARPLAAALLAWTLIVMIGLASPAAVGGRSDRGDR